MDENWCPILGNPQMYFLGGELPTDRKYVSSPDSQPSGLTLQTSHWQNQGYEPPSRPPFAAENSQQVSDRHNPLLGGITKFILNLSYDIWIIGIKSVSPSVLQTYTKNPICFHIFCCLLSFEMGTCPSKIAGSRWIFRAGRRDYQPWMGGTKIWLVVSNMFYFP